MISPELGLSDFQGALLTSGYSYLYALALVPVGLLADKVDRPKLLAVGLALWSSLSIISSRAGSFGELLIVRTGFAIAQAAQNPVSFSLIPDLFPANKSTALAGYNCAIYLGRALSFASVLAAHRVGAAKSGLSAGLTGVGTMADAAAGVAADEGVALSMVPLDALDLQRMSIIYTMGDMAAVTPLYNYNFHVIAYEAAAGSGGGGWRDLFTWIGIPGFAIALLMLLTVREPRHAEAEGSGSKGSTAPGPGFKGSAVDGVQGSAGPAAAAVGVSVTDPSSWREGASNLSAQLLNMVTGHGWHNSSSSSNNEAPAAAAAAAAAEPVLSGPACIVELEDSSTAAAAASAEAEADPAAAAAAAGDAPPTTALAVASSTAAAASTALVAKLSHNPVSDLLGMKAFQATTVAAALNDVGSYALIAWHSTFYERVFGLDSGVYAPMLAVILPVGGILGGVGGGLIADWLSVVGGRYWLTAGASLLAAPFVAQSLLADSPGGSFTALLVGFALSEAWRAPGAIMIRSVAPQELGSTASALYLCIRNLIGGFGPVAVAKLAEVVGLQHAMLLAPCCYVVSGLIFLVAEKEIELQNQQQQQQQAAALQQQ
ncbi:hypothetical protein OEZ85_000532 [Tetradesmus obliquus]|uniref:Major facilitator superfamily (MFS) profile domain-containing protein n=1 Tax=Tetradesmus obliquus TaxID=3088 RepID=A0ABY8UIU6_TETOB|nr:hypothetical protein OEZ85_000532 [Tetradesmus obliquus]